MGPNYTGNHLLDDALRRLEGLPLTPARTAVPNRQARYRKVLPDLVRSWLGPLGDRVEEMSLASERGGRLCYAIPHNDLSGAVRFNVVGREPSGRVKRGEEYDALCASLRRDLMELRNPDTGTPVVSDVLKTSDRTSVGISISCLTCWWLESRAADFGDRVGEDRRDPGFRMRNVQGITRPTVFSSRVDPDDVAELADPVPVENFAPTIAALLGVALPDVDGSTILPRA